MNVRVGEVSYSTVPVGAAAVRSKLPAGIQRITVEFCPKLFQELGFSQTEGEPDGFHHDLHVPGVGEVVGVDHCRILGISRSQLDVSLAFWVDKDGYNPQSFAETQGSPQTEPFIVY